MGARRIRREQRRFDMNLSRQTNGMRKDKERARRDARIRELIKSGKFPYTPVVMSYLSAELGKPATRIVPADVDKFLATKKDIPAAR
jgi:hypothetical protein